MQQLDEIVKFYLKTDTTYALMITGEWGTGKTYYFKNSLVKLISETPTFANYQKKYRPVLVSLFGLKSIEEIQSEIFLTLYPILKNKTLKLGASIGNSLMKGILHIYGFGNFHKYVSETEIEKGEWLNLNELVICFDDLERLSKNLKIEELIGYVNSLVENENVKVILIANENKIKKKNYSALKEKVTGNRIEFLPDFRNSFDSLVTAKFAGFPLYYSFLIDRKNFILETFERNSSNLRILLFALTYFHTIHSYYIKELSSPDILKEKEEEVLNILLKFTLAVSAEYKIGKISFKVKNELDKTNELRLNDIILDSPQFGTHEKEESEKKLTYKDNFIAQYYHIDEFYFFNSIFNFLTGGSIFNFEELVKELKAKYHIEENKVLPQYNIYNQLSYPAVWTLADKEYKQYTKQMLAYTDKGSYELIRYPTIFHLASRFNNPLRFNLDKLEKRIINGMKKGRINYKYNDSLNHYLRVDSNSENKEHLIRVTDATLNFNGKIFEENKVLELKQLEELCYSRFELFSSELMSSSNAYFSSPLLNYFKVNKFYFFFLKSNGSIQWGVIRLLKVRYQKNPSSLKPEITFLENLKQRIDKKSKTIPKRGIKNYIFRELADVLQTSIDRLNESNA